MHLYNPFRLHGLEGMAVDSQDLAQLKTQAANLFAAGSYRDAAALRAQILKTLQASQPSDQSQLMDATHDLALAYRRCGRYADAEPLYRRCVEWAQSALPDNNPTKAIYINDLAVLLYLRGEYGQSRQMSEQVVRLEEGIYGAHHSATAQVLVNHANLLRAIGDYKEALRCMERGIACYQQQNPPTSEIRFGWLRFGQLLHAMGYLAEAEFLLRLAFQMQEQAGGKEHPQLADNLSALANVLLHLKKHQEAAELAMRGLEIAQRKLDSSSPDVARNLLGLAATLAETDLMGRAPSLAQQALSIRQSVLGHDHPETAAALSVLGEIAARQSRFADAQKHIRAAIAIWEKRFGANHPPLAEALNNLAFVLIEIGKYSEAEQLLSRALNIIRPIAANHYFVVYIFQNFAALAPHTGDAGRADEFLKKADLVAADPPRYPLVRGWMNKPAAVSQKEEKPPKPTGDVASISRTTPPVEIGDNSMLGRRKSEDCAMLDKVPPRDFAMFAKVHPSGEIRGDIRPSLAVFKPVTIRLDLPRQAFTSPLLPDKVIDHVHFAVTGPSALKKGQCYVLDVWAFLAEQREAVINAARQSCDGQFSFRSRGPTPVQRGTSLQVHLELGEVKVEDPIQPLFWAGEIGNATFAIHIHPYARIGSHRGRLSIYCGTLCIARLFFTVVIANEAAPVSDLPLSGSRCRTAFASYAHEDKDDVLARVQGLEKAGVQVFVDVKELRSGQRYEQVLLQMLATRDIFYLFWSRAASKSAWVEKEWRCALKKRGIDYIDPIPLVPPAEVPPPRELAEHLHFNDWVLAYMRGRATTR